MTTAAALSLLTVFLASGVEAVEALTVVLAVGVTRNWRVALGGAAWALAALAVVVTALGPPLVAFVPLAVLRLVVGTFLLLMGLDWLRKAIRRYAGRKAMRDETAAFERTVKELHGAAALADRVGFATAFKATFLEGLEVAVIVITLGASSSGGIALAAAAALAAVLLVAAAGAAIARPLARVPENAMKAVTGVMLCSFGTYWSGEGLGIVWWHADLAIVLLAAIYASTAFGLVAAARVRAPAHS
jgi:uncharacterized membrane protein